MMMKKRIIRHNFNMVEIMLAVIVIALGLTSTFVLFPVGLNASKDAVAENHISDASEAVITEIHRLILPKMFNTTSGKGFAFKSFDDLKAYFYDPETASNEVKKYIKEGIETPPGDGFSELGAGVYLFYYASPVMSTMSQVIATIKLDRNSDSGFEDEYFYSRNGTFQKYSDLKSTTGDCINKFLLPITIEVSWPATLPIGEREKRIFRFDMFNLEYDPGNDTEANP